MFAHEMPLVYRRAVRTEHTALLGSNRSTDADHGTAGRRRFGGAGLLLRHPFRGQFAQSRRGAVPGRRQAEPYLPANPSYCFVLTPPLLDAAPSAFETPALLDVYNGWTSSPPPPLKSPP